MEKKHLPDGRLAQGPLPVLDIPFVGEDGKLPHEQWDENLRIYVANHSSYIDGTIIRLTVNTVDYGTPVTVAPEQVGNPDIRYLFELVKEHFPAGNPAVEVALNYKAQNPDTGDISSSPYTYTLIFDKEAPGGNPLAYIAFTPAQLQGIYPTDIVEGHLRTIQPPWSGMDVGDTLTPWVGSAPPEEGNIDSGLTSETQVEIDRGAVGRPVNLWFPASRLEALGDIPQHFGYQLKDSLGNTSNISPTREIAVHLQTPDSKRPLSTRETLPVPRVTRRQSSNLPGLEITGIRPRDGRLPLAMLERIISVTIPEPPFPGPGQTAQLLVNGFDLSFAIGAPVPTAVSGPSTVDIALADQPLLDSTNYPGVTWSLDYWLNDPISGGAGPSYKPLRIIFDKYAPCGLPPTPPALSFTDEQLTGITEDDIDPTQDGVIVHIAPWYDDDYDDQVELWLGTGQLETDGNYITPLPPLVTDPKLGIDVVFPRAELEAFPPGPVYFGYRVTDWVGNVSNLSATTRINVYLTGLPEDLEAPLIPEAAPYNPDTGAGPVGTGLLTWDEANPSTTVRIPAYTGNAPGDRIYLKWNTQIGIPPVPVTQDDIDDEPTNGYLLETELPFVPYVLSDTGGDNIGIWYEVHGAGGTPPVESPKQYINVNLETPGGPDPDPDPETPEHENLRPPQLLSTFAGSVPNIIPAEAYTSPATLTIFRAGAITTGDPIWRNGDTISIFWGADHADDPADIPINPGNEAIDITVNVPATMIDSNGPGPAIPLYYVITRVLSPGNTSSATSPETLLNVTAPGALPGGPDDLVEADFPEAQTLEDVPYKVLRKDQGIDGSYLRIPLDGVANVDKDDFITVDFVGRNSQTDPTAAPIEPSRIRVVDHVINEDDMRLRYFEVPLPYVKTFLICRNLSTTDYTIRNAAGAKPGLQQIILIALNDPGQGCRLPSP